MLELYQITWTIAGLFCLFYVLPLYIKAVQVDAISMRASVGISIFLALVVMEIIIGVTGAL